jgi:cobalt-zinc-cadmium efflux system outer membrane protein
MKPLPAAIVISAFLLFATRARAETACATLTRENVGPCAVAASPDVRAAALTVTARQAEIGRARVLLPSNPTLGLSFAGRRSAEDSAFNAYAQLGQEIEIGGQRGARGREAEARVGASEATKVVVARDIAADALTAYFEVLAAREEVALLRRVETLATRVADVARAQAKAGAGSELDADVAEAQAQKRTQSRMVTEGKAAAAEVRLSRLVGQTAIVVDGKLEPLVSARQQPSARVLALQKEAVALDAQASVLSRSRMPNVTVSVFAQSDGFRERVLGAGLSVPIPLPEPLGRSRASDIAVVRAEADATRAEAEAKRAGLSREADAQQAETDALVRAAASIDEARASRAEASLGKLAEEVEKGRLQAREAFVAQDALTEMLGQRITAKREACLASVKLAALRGAPLDRGAR